VAILRCHTGPVVDPDPSAATVRIGLATSAESTSDVSDAVAGCVDAIPEASREVDGPESVGL
jgi:hypothetical protein